VGILLCLLAAVCAASPPEAVEGAPVPLLSAVSVEASTRSSAPAEVPLRRDGESKVDPRATFRIDAGAPLADARLVLYDAAEALVPAAEASEIGSGICRLRLAPSRPLRPGARYVLRLEGAAGSEIHDLAGKRYRPLTFTVITTGEAEGAPAKRRRS